MSRRLYTWFRFSGPSFASAHMFLSSSLTAQPVPDTGPGWGDPEGHGAALTAGEAAQEQRWEDRGWSIRYLGRGKGREGFLEEASSELGLKGRIGTCQVKNKTQKPEGQSFLSRGNSMGKDRACLAAGNSELWEVQWEGFGWKGTG